MNAQIIPFPSLATNTSEKSSPDYATHQLDEFTIRRAAALLAKKWPEGVAGRKAQREREQQACDDQASELRQCLIRALIREKLGVTGKSIGKLRPVRESATPPSPDAA